MLVLEPLQLVPVGERAARLVLDQEIVERHAVGGGVDARIDDVAAGQADRPGETVEQAWLVGGVDRRQRRAALRQRRQLQRRRRFSTSARIGRDHRRRLGEPIAVGQRVGEAGEALRRQPSNAAASAFTAATRSRPAVLLVAEPQASPPPPRTGS